MFNNLNNINKNCLKINYYKIVKSIKLRKQVVRFELQKKKNFVTYSKEMERINKTADVFLRNSIFHLIQVASTIPSSILYRST